MSCTARVMSYDPSTFEVTVQPIPSSDTFEDADGVAQPLSVPAISGVPFGCIEAGGHHVRVAPAEGDYVTLVFSDRSLDAFLATKSESDPADQRRHALSDAIAYPLFSSIRPAGLPAGVLSIGANEGTDDFVALASKVLARLSAIVTAFNSHTHPVSGTATLSPATPMASPASVASASVNVRG